jgi:hypothetical protein
MPTAYYFKLLAPGNFSEVPCFQRSPAALLRILDTLLIGFTDQLAKNN